MTKTTFRPHVAERPGRCGMSSLVAQSRCPALPKTPGFQDLLVVQAPDLLLGLQDLKGFSWYTLRTHSRVLGGWS